MSERTFVVFSQDECDKLDLMLESLVEYDDGWGTEESVAAVRAMQEALKRKPIKVQDCKLVCKCGGSDFTGVVETYSTWALEVGETDQDNLKGTSPVVVFTHEETNEDEETFVVCADCGQLYELDSSIEVSFE